MRIILADDDEECRLRPMTEAVRETFTGVEVIWARTVEETIDTVMNTPGLSLASIDHDFGQGRRTTGVDVAFTLSQWKPRCPLLIQTASPSPGNLMEQVLVGAGWNAKFVARDGVPHDRWLQDVWLPAAQVELARLTLPGTRPG